MSILKLKKYVYYHMHFQKADGHLLHYSKINLYITETFIGTTHLAQDKSKPWEVAAQNQYWI